MEHFSIQCTTCRARLTVKDESVIGAILACPKCRSMVHVVPPVDWNSKSQVAAAAVVAAPTALPTPPAGSSSAIAAQSSGISSRVNAPSATQSLSRVQPPPLPAPAVAAQASPVPPQPVEPQVAANGLVDVLLQRLMKDWPLLAGGLGSGVALGVGLWLVMWLSGPGDVPTNEVSSDLAVATAPPEKTPQDASALDLEKPITLADTSVEPPTAATAIESRAATAETKPTVEATPAELSSAASETDSVASVPAPNATDTATEAATAPARSMRFEPVAPAASAAENEAATARSAVPATHEVPPVADTPLPQRTTAATQPRSAANEVTPLGLSRTEVERRLSRRMSTVQFEDVPLADFAKFVGDLTGLTMSIDDAALSAVGLGRNTPVTVRLSETTAAAALASAVKPLGLTCSLREGRVVITTRQP